MATRGTSSSTDRQSTRPGGRGGQLFLLFWVVLVLLLTSLRWAGSLSPTMPALELVLSQCTGLVCYPLFWVVHGTVSVLLAVLVVIAVHRLRPSIRARRASE